MPRCEYCKLYKPVFVDGREYVGCCDPELDEKYAWNDGSRCTEYEEVEEEVMA